MSSTPVPPESALRRLVKCLLTLAVHFALFFMLILLLIKLVPVHMAHFEQFHFSLPEITILLDHVSQLFISYWIAILPLGMMLDTAIVFLVYFLTARQRWLQISYGYLWFVGIIVLIGLIQLGLTLPLVEIGTEISGEGLTP